MSRPSQTVKLLYWPRDPYAQRMWRRNYTWMREAGVSPVVARLILDSTARVTELDRLLAVPA